MSLKVENLIVLLTDFSEPDGFAGVMKGVILSIHPGAQIIDLAHGLPPQDIRGGAFLLASHAPYFPRGTIFIGVVDPGVGSNRRGILIQTNRFFFIGPDNGLFSWALRNEKVKRIVEITNPKWMLETKRSTFDGRDVFAPAAAHLAKGVALSRFGPDLNHLVELPWPEPQKRKNAWKGEVIHVDRFGNLISNLHRDLLKPGGRKKVLLGRKVIGPIRRSYSAVKAGESVALFSSAGFLEIALSGANAAKILGEKTGSKITLFF